MNEQPSNMFRQRREHLIRDFLKGKQTDFLEQNTRVLDNYFHESYEKSVIGPRLGIAGNSYTVIALGGYGREEQCICSDVDILFLFDKKVPSEAEELIREIIYPLWDAGMDVGHATRSVEECLDIAAKDIEVFTSLLDARFVCGMSLFYSKMVERLRKKVILRNSERFVTALIGRNRERHEHFGDSAYLLEPNLKEGQGGLRDYHTILWTARITADIKQPRDLEYYGCFSHDEFEMLTESLSFIWQVRNRLHHLTGRKCDQLHFEYQIELADATGFEKHNGQQPVEHFLGSLHRHMEFIKHQYLMLLYEMDKKKRKGKKKFRTKTDGLEVRDGMLFFVSSRDIPNHPDFLIKIFRESARLKLPLSAEARRLVKDFLYLADDKFRAAPDIVRIFEQILIEPAPKFNVLDEMLNTGFLIKFVPEFEGIVDRIQYDEYHMYPVHKHLLRTVQTIKKFGTSEDPTVDSLCADLYDEISDKRLLLWGALLHDIGKGESDGRHSEKGAGIVRGVLAEKGYTADETEKVAFLVEEHLLMMKTATRRDIQDEETAIFCAERIKNADQLKMLYLLSVADAVSTGPKAWGGWNSTLLASLFFNVLNTLEKGELATREAVASVEKKKKGILNIGDISTQDIQMIFNAMSPRYMLYSSADEIREHIILYRNLGSDDFVWKIDKSAELNTRTLTVCAKDRPGFFSKISGVLTLNSIDILNARIYTWRNNIALDIFKVRPPLDQIFEDEKWERAATALRAALSDELNISEALEEHLSIYGTEEPRTSKRPHRVVVDNESSSFFTIIEVFTYDFPGLLFSITDTLYKCGLDIWFAKIATKVDQVVDIFYVRDINGQKAGAPAQVLEMETAIRIMLETNSPL